MKRVTVVEVGQGAVRSQAVMFFGQNVEAVAAAQLVVLVKDPFEQPLHYQPL